MTFLKFLLAAIALVAFNTSRPAGDAYSLCDVRTIVGPDASEAPDRSVNQIAVAPDGSLWGIESQNYRLIHVMPNGGVFELALEKTAGSASYLAVGADGTVAFAEFRAGQPIGGDLAPEIIGVRPPGGIVEEFPLPSSIKKVTDLKIGPDGSIWFADSFDNIVGRLKNGRIWSRHIGVGPGQLISIDVDAANNAWVAVGNLPSPGRILEINQTGMLRSFSVPFGYVASFNWDGKMGVIDGVRNHVRSVCYVGISEKSSVGPCIPEQDYRFFAIAKGVGLLLVSGQDYQNLYLVNAATRRRVYSGVSMVEVVAGSEGRVWIVAQPMNTFLTGTLCEDGR